ncbi:helix-turn-helix transcriptional regulator [Actinomadura rupiterrae]|uniref:helix-turn-helix transcriptional regulator n=1 Tax=Actinomadura rupiterrae TaxID=559627 RepID=UPI0020A5D325|nr:WYL domain-containing protein [Actinomadura rupiterrae]MCP2343081.1 biotin operon repressor [Actinomadura rupiterrae]
MEDDRGVREGLPRRAASGDADRASDLDRVDRLLLLVTELRRASPGELEAGELAGRVGVSARTVRRDMELLAHGGLPVRHERGRGYAVEPEPEGEPLDEAASLVGPVRDTLAEAVRTRRVVRLVYTDRDGERTVRDVEAHGLVTAPYAEYLVGWCRMREGPRLFRLERIGAAYLSGRGAGVRDLDALLAALRVPVPRPPAEPAPRGPVARDAAGAARARAWTLDRIEFTRTRLREAVAAARSPAGRSRASDGGVVALRGVLGHLAEWTRWQSAAVRSAVTGEPPVEAGRPPEYPEGFARVASFDAWESMVQDAMAVRSLGELARDLSQVLEDLARWVADSDDAVWRRPVPEPRRFGAAGPARPPADLLAGWRGPLAHIEWHLDRLTEEPPPPPGGVSGEEELWVVDRCPLQP